VGIGGNLSPPHFIVMSRGSSGWLPGEAVQEDFPPPVQNTHTFSMVG
jgi:hypothetical protein